MILIWQMRPERIARLQQQIAREMTKREEITEKQPPLLSASAR